jgi:hypothetical protein
VTNFIMMRLKSFALISGLLLSATVSAMSFTQIGDTLIMSGKVEGSDVDKFSKFDGIEHVILRDSPGGNLKASMEIGYLIRDAKITTTADGYCYSGCAMMFLGGVTRTMKPKAMLGFHGSFAEGYYTGDTNARMADYSEFMTSGGFVGPLASEAFYELQSNNLLIFRDSGAILRKNGKSTILRTNARLLGIVN